MCWWFLSQFRFLILLTVFELLPKTFNFTICSIFSNSGHVGWCTASPDTILKLDTLVMIQTKFDSNWSSSFRGEDLWKSLRRTTTTDSSHELKILYHILIPILCKDLNWQEMHSLRIQLMLSIFLKCHKKWWKMLQNICNKCRFPWQPAQIFWVWKIVKKITSL
jgi:hypothetical protein